MSLFLDTTPVPTQHDAPERCSTSPAEGTSETSTRRGIRRVPQPRHAVRSNRPMAGRWLLGLRARSRRTTDDRIASLRAARASVELSGVTDVRPPCLAQDNQQLQVMMLLRAFR